MRIVDLAGNTISIYDIIDMAHTISADDEYLPVCGPGTKRVIDLLLRNGADYDGLTFGEGDLSISVNIWLPEGALYFFPKDDYLPPTKENLQREAVPYLPALQHLIDTSPRITGIDTRPSSYEPKAA